MISSTLNTISTGWDKVRLGDALTLINGRAFKPTEWSQKGLPIVRIQNLNNPDAPFNYYEGMLPEKLLLNTGDLLFAWSGTPGTSFGAHIWRGKKAWLNQHIFKIVFNENEFDKRFLQLAINQNLQDYIAQAHGAAGLAHITKGKFESSELPKPPITLQRKIVAELDKQFSRLDEAVANLKRVKANLKRYKAAVLKAAVEGRLVETEAELSRREGRSYENGAQLMQRILENRRRQWKGKGKYKEAFAPDTTDLPGLPDGWVWASLEQSCVKITDGTHHSPKNFPQGEYKYITSKNVRAFRMALEDITFVDKKTHDEIYSRCDVRKGDVLYVKDGVNTGLAAKNTLEEPFSLLSSVGVFRTVSDLDSDYLVIYLNSTEVRDRMLANIAGVAITRLTLNKLKVTMIAIPPLMEQHRIAAEVDRRFSIVGESEAEIDTNLKRAERLQQAILSKAFTESLTPSDRSIRPQLEIQ